MARNEFMMLIFSLVILVLLGGVFIALFTGYVKQRCKLVKVGAVDEEILKEYDYEHSTKSKVLSVLGKIVELIVCVFLIFVFVVSAYSKYNDGKFLFSNVGTVKVVASESMSQKNKKNTYLEENGLDNQFSMYDIIIVKELPDEFDLKLYDVVVYEKEGVEVIHRIIDIEEPNESHPNQRWFTLKGDANSATDVRPVLYSQMKSIYTSEKISVIGIFVLWLQSPLGYLVLLVVLFYLIFEPICEKILKKVRNERIALLRCDNVDSVIITDNLVKEDQEENAEENGDDEQEDGDDEQEDSDDEQENGDNIGDNLNEMLSLENTAFVDDGEDKGVLVLGDKKINVRYNKSFTANVIQAEENTKNVYTEVKNYLLSYGLSPRMSWKCESFYKGKETYAKFKVVGKSIAVFLALDPENYEGSKYNFNNLGNSKKYERTPFEFKVRSARSVKWVKELIDDLMQNNDITQIKNYVNEKYELSYEKVESLISKGYIKLMVDGKSQNVGITGKINGVDSNN